MKEFFVKVDDILAKCENWIVASGLIVATLIVIYNVVMRYAFKASVIWAEEMVRYIMIWVTFIGASLCIRHNIHVKIEILQNKLPFKWAKIQATVIYVICIAGSIFLAYLGVVMTARIATSLQTSPTLTWFPMWIVNLAIPLFGILAVKDYTQLLVLNLVRKDKVVLAVKEEDE